MHSKFEGAHHSIFTNPSPNPPPYLGMKSNFGFSESSKIHDQSIQSGPTTDPSRINDINVNKIFTGNPSQS